jgi:iron complex transport system ATP-binding protein
MLRAADVWFGYSDSAPVLRGVSVEIPHDGLVGILGPNGSGKTTLLRLLAGTRQPQRGVVTLDGTPLQTLPRPRLSSRMAVVPQETHLAFDYSVAEVAMMGRYPHLRTFEIEGPDDIAIVDESLERTGTRHLKERLFNTLSGGEKQRVVIASALAQLGRRNQSDEFSILLLDEPTASLDLGYQLDVVSILERLHATHRIAIVVSTHDLNLAATLCQTLIMVRDGEVLATGAVADVLTPENIRRLYGVDAEIVERPSGRRVVVPLRRGEEARR